MFLILMTFCYHYILDKYRKSGIEGIIDTYVILIWNFTSLKLTCFVKKILKITKYLYKNCTVTSAVWLEL